MIKIYVNSVDRTGDIERGSIERANEIQQRADSLDFLVFQGVKPLEYQDVQLYIYDEIVSIVGTTITLLGKFEKNTSKFWAGQKLKIRIGEADEETVVVSTYDEDTLTIVLVAAPTVTVNAGDGIGELFFGGVISRVGDQNVEHLSNLEYNVECVSYVKIFDRKLVSDSWADVDARYIINDFVNSTVNYNATLDNMSYANNAAIQAEFIESGTAGNPTVDLADYLESSSSALLPWTGSGTATWSATPLAQNLSDLTGANSGAPTKGQLMLWVKPTNYTLITSIKLRVGSDSSNYVELTLPKTVDNDWQYLNANLVLGTVVGTPVWTAANYIAVIVAETASSSIRVNGFRLNSSKSFTVKNVEPTIEFTDFRAPQIKPTSLMQLLAKNFQYIWYIDYERDINFKSAAIIPAPYGFTDTSDNFYNLSIEVDQSQLGNRIVIKGGERTSIGVYSEVRQGNNAQREWLMKSKFNNLTVYIDNNTTTDTAEVGTTTTNLRMTAHGLATGAFLINRTRNNAVREVTVVDANNVTVETVPLQASGDAISLFGTIQTIGIEGLVDETTVDYVYNSNEKSVRAATNTITLPTTTFIKFAYNERIAVNLQYTDPTSANALKAMGIGDGIFDMDSVTDRNITDTGTALALAKAKINDYRNPIIKGSAGTDQDGLHAGQTININDSVRGVNSNYVIQTIKSRLRDGEFGDYFSHDVNFGTTLFGIIEFYQKLLKTNNQIEVGTDDLVETYIAGIEDMTLHDVSSVTLSGFKKATILEDMTTDDFNTLYKNTGGWQYEPSTGQTFPTRYNLASYS